MRLVEELDREYGKTETSHGLMEELEGTSAPHKPAVLPNEKLNDRWMATQISKRGMPPKSKNITTEEILPAKVNISKPKPVAAFKNPSTISKINAAVALNPDASFDALWMAVQDTHPGWDKEAVRQAYNNAVNSPKALAKITEQAKRGAPDWNLEELVKSVRHYKLYKNEPELPQYLVNKGIEAVGKGIAYAGREIAKTPIAANVGLSPMEKTSMGVQPSETYKNKKLAPKRITKLPLVVEMTINNAGGLAPYVIPVLGQAGMAAQIPELAKEQPVVDDNGQVVLDANGKPKMELGVTQMINGITRRFSDPVAAIKRGELPNLIFDLFMTWHGAKKLAKATKGATPAVRGETLMGDVVTEKTGRQQPYSQPAYIEPVQPVNVNEQKIGETAVPISSKKGALRLAPDVVKVSEDITNAFDFVKNGVVQLKNILNPAGASSEAGDMALHLRKLSGVEKLERARLEKANIETKQFFDKMPREQHIDFIERMDKGLPQSTPELQGIADRYKTAMADVYETEKAMFTNMGYIENYFPRNIFYEGNKAIKYIEERMKGSTPEEAAINTGVKSKRRYLAINKGTGFKETRTSIGQNFGDFIQELQDNGFKLKTTNPESIIQARLHEHMRAVLGNEMLKTALDEGLLVPTTQGRSGVVLAPKNITDLIGQDKLIEYARKNGYEGDPLEHKWELGGEPHTIQVLKNFFSKSWNGEPLYDSLQSMNNAVIQFRLGLSGYHALTIGLDSLFQTAGLGMRQTFTRGQTAQGLRTLAKANPLGALQLYKQGKTAINQALTAPSIEGLPREIKAYYEAGGTTTPTSEYYANAWNELKQHFVNKEYLHGIAKAPKAIVEEVAKPMFSKWIPALKMAVFMDEAKVIYKRLDSGEITEKQAKQLLGRKMNTVEEQMGQVNYDNWMWDRRMRNIAHLTITAVGWRGGTANIMSRAVSDTVKQMKAALFGKTSELPIDIKGMSSTQGNVVAGLAVAAFYGGLATYLLTGKYPTNLKDTIFFKTGVINDRGKEERKRLPGYYGKDYSDVLKYFYTWNNKDILGGIEDWAMSGLSPAATVPGDISQAYKSEPEGQKLKGMAKAALEAVTPISVKNIRKSWTGDTKEKIGETLAGLAGITPAKSWVDETKGERLVREALGDRGYFGSQDIEKYNVKKEIRIKIREGKDLSDSDVESLQKAGVRDIGRFVQNAYLDIFEIRWRQLKYEDRKRIYPDLNKEQRNIADKYRNE